MILTPFNVLTIIIFIIIFYLEKSDTLLIVDFKKKLCESIFLGLLIIIIIEVFGIIIKYFLCL